MKLYKVYFSYFSGEIDIKEITVVEEKEKLLKLENHPDHLSQIVKTRVGVSVFKTEKEALDGYIKEQTEKMEGLKERLGMINQSIKEAESLRNEHH